MEEMAKKRVKDSETEQSYLLMHRHINGYGRLFGGQLVAWIDELAGLVGRRHCGHEITTACIDNLNFKHPAFLNDTVVLVGRVTYVGRTSMEVRVDTYVEELATGIRKMINRAYVVMVAIDENGRALPVPGLILESFKKIPPCPLTGGIFHVKVKAVIRLTEVEMTTGSIA